MKRIMLCITVLLCVTSGLYSAEIVGRKELEENISELSLVQSSKQDSSDRDCPEMDTTNDLDPLDENQESHTPSSAEIAIKAIEMVFIQGGSFTMGDTRGGGDRAELPTHSVSLDSFYIGKYELKQAEYQAVMGPIRNMIVELGMIILSITFPGILPLSSAIF